MSHPLTKSDILQRRGDLSPFLIHLTRDGLYTKRADAYGLQEDEKTTIEAKDSLEKILLNNSIEARSAFGDFNYLVKTKYPTRTTNPNSKIERRWLHSVCFTETPLDHVKIQCSEILGRRLHFKPYGLAFFEEAIRTRKGNPVTYIDSRSSDIWLGFKKLSETDLCESLREFLPLVEAFGPPRFPSRYNPVKEIDFRWEREWRIPGTFSFTLDDVAFGLCPTNEITHFESLAQNKIPFVDPMSDMTAAKSKLRAWPKLTKLK